MVRRQSASGYIDEFTYSADGQHVVQHREALKPVGCDPATDTLRCRQTPDTLPTVQLEPTASTETTGYAYNDAAWPHRPTSTSRASVLEPNQSVVDQATFHPLSGVTLSSSRIGYTGDPVQQQTRTTTTTLNDGAMAAPFAPGGNFDAAWLTLPQPPGTTRQVDGPRTDVSDLTSYVYYPLGTAVPALLRGNLAAVRNALGHTTRFEEYDLFGNVVRTVDPNGVVQLATYDRVGRLLTTTILGIPNCNTADDALCATDLTTTRVYQGAGPLIREQRPSGAVTVYQYGTRSRLRYVSRGPSPTDLRERIEYEYDAVTGKRSAEKIQAYEGAAWLEKRSTSYLYDSFERLAQTFHAGGASVANTYDAEGRIASVRDENHTTANTRYTYDPAGQLVTVRQDLGASEIVTTYGYDGAGHLNAVTDPAGNVTQYQFDDFGRMLEQTSPVSGITRHTYDLGGNVLTTTDANDAATSRSYDALGRPTESVSMRAGLPAETVQWTYDAGPFSVGRTSSVTDPSGGTAYQYERRGLLRSEQTSPGGSTYTSRYGYDGNGNRVSITHPSGQVVTYGFDYADRQVSATLQSTVLVSSASYLPFGPLKTVVYGNGTTTAVQYDARYRPLERKLTSTAGVIAEYDYTHDPAGNITAIADATDASFNRQFGYDDLNRLTVANGGASLWGNGAYTYDAMGNLKTLALGTARVATFTNVATTPLLATAVETV